MHKYIHINILIYGTCTYIYPGPRDEEYRATQSGWNQVGGPHAKGHQLLSVVIPSYCGPAQ